MAALCRGSSLTIRSLSAAYSTSPIQTTFPSLDPLPCRTPLRCHRFIHVGPLQSVLPRPTSTMVPTSDPVLDIDYGHFKLLQSFSVKYAPIRIQKWRSERTGLTVVVGSHATPIVSSRPCDRNRWLMVDVEVDQRPLRHCFRECVSTQLMSRLMRKVFDDTGRPHTLEQCEHFSSVGFD